MQLKLQKRNLGYAHLYIDVHTLAVVFRSILGAGRHLYSAKPTETRGLGCLVLSEVPLGISPLMTS